MGWLPDPSTSVRLRYGAPCTRRVSELYANQANDGVLTRITVWNRAAVSEGRLAGAALDVFERSLHDLRDRRVLYFDRDVLRKVSLDTETLSISIIKTGDDWSFVNPSFGEIDIALVSTLLGSLEAMK